MIWSLAGLPDVVRSNQYIDESFQSFAQALLTRFVGYRKKAYTPNKLNVIYKIQSHSYSDLYMITVEPRARINNSFLFTTLNSRTQVCNQMRNHCLKMN